MMSNDKTLFSAQGSNAAGTPVTWPGGTGLYWVRGTFGSGTCTLEFSVDETNWISVGTDGALTASGS